jgi:DNA-binding transcriptional ArsR family regulator
VGLGVLEGEDYGAPTGESPLPKERGLHNHKVSSTGPEFGRGSAGETCASPSPPITYNHMVVGYGLAEDEIDRIFGALADETRRDILGRAIRHEQSVSALARQYAMSFAAVQKHVAVLERAMLVTKERRGREQIVHANRATVGKAATLLDNYEQLWIERANRIADILANPKGERT